MGECVCPVRGDDGKALEDYATKCTREAESFEGQGLQSRAASSQVSWPRYKICPPRRWRPFSVDGQGERGDGQGLLQSHCGAMLGEGDLLVKSERSWRMAMLGGRGKDNALVCGEQ